MIKCDKGIVEIKGEESMVLAELSTFIHHLHHRVFVEIVELTPEESKETILEAVENGFLSEEEIKAKKEFSKEEAKVQILKALDDLKAILQGKGEK